MLEKLKEVLGISVGALDSYNPEISSTDDHIDNFISHHRDLEEDETALVCNVFQGVVRFDQVLSVVTNGFFVRDGKNVRRSSENLYKVICYLALFRLDELGMPQFRRLVKSQDTHNMHKFLRFFTDEKNLRTWVKDEWNKLYDTSFVQRSLLSPILSHLPKLQELVKQLKDKLDNKVPSKKISAKPTETKPFNLTQPRPRSVPMPEPIPQMRVYRPAPRSTYAQPRENDVIDAAKDENRSRAQDRLHEATRLQFSCANPEKSEKTRRRLREIHDEEQSKLLFDKHKSNPVPTAILKEKVAIRLNAAAILREGKLYQKREQEELKRLELLEAGARDPSEFISWQQRMRQQDLDRELAEIERRKLEGKLSLEEAILARQNLITKNQERVTEMKQEAQQMMNDYLNKRLQQEQQMRRLVETVMEGHENAKDAKRALQQYKSRIVAEVNEESRELMRQALEQAEVEMRSRMELIQQIRALESKPVIRHKLVDLTSTPGYGLLSEMSIAELRERLHFLKISDQEAEEEKRDSILANKQAKDQMLIDTLETIARHRRENSKATSNRSDTKKKALTESRAPHDEKLAELQRKLEEKRAERKSAQLSAQLRPDRQSAARLQHRMGAKKLEEQSRWEDVERARDRTAKLSSLGINSSKTASRLLANQNEAVVLY